MTKKSEHSTHLIAAGIVIVGLSLVVIGQNAKGKFEFGEIAVSVGSTIMFIGALHWLYDTFSKKALVAELIETILGTKSVADSGIVEFVDNSLDINFNEPLDSSHRLRTMFNYNSRFLMDYDKQIDGLLARGGTVELIFLDSRSSTIDHMKHLGWEPTSIDAHYVKIGKATKIWKKKYGDKVRIQFVDQLLKYSAVQIDSSMYLIMSTCTNQRQAVPVIRIKQDTALWKFVSDDLDHLMRGKQK